MDNRGTDKVSKKNSYPNQFKFRLKKKMLLVQLKNASGFIFLTLVV